MAFKAMIHEPEDAICKTKLMNSLARFWAEATVKYLRTLKLPDDTLDTLAADIEQKIKKHSVR